MFPLTPTLSLNGEGAVRARIILWGSLTPQGEGIISAYFYCGNFTAFGQRDSVRENQTKN